MKHNHWYHITLRTSAAVVALLLLFDSGLLSPITKELSLGAQRYVANGVGVVAGVEPTELNQITAALTKQEQELATRERALREREIEVNLAQTGTGQNPSTYILSALLSVLLLLIIINYILDFYRSRPNRFRTQYE